MQTTALPLLLALCFCSAAPLRAALIYEPSGDFSATENPHGVWTYGFSQSLGGDLLLFKGNTPATAALGPIAFGLEGWFQNYGLYAPLVIHNPATNTISNDLFGDSSSLEPGGIALHPGENNEYAVLRFTVPNEGSYEIAGAFFGDNTKPTTTDVHILVNGAVIFDDVVEGVGPSSARNFNETRQLTPGDTVDFAVGFGLNENFASDLTGLNLTITQTTGVYDVRSDFSDTNPTNPSGPWTFGQSGALDSGFTPYSTTFKRRALDYWTQPPGPDPSVGHNPDKAPQLLNEVYFKPHELILHPGPVGEYSIVRWTAPAAGKYLLESAFFGEGGFSTTDVHIRKNGQPLFDSAINGRGKRAPYSSILSVAVGDTVDFAVGYGADQDYTADTTGLDAKFRLLTQTASTNLTSRLALQLAWPAEPGAVYQLQAATTIDAPTWQNIALPFHDPSYTNAFTDIANPKLFYRLLKYK